jgi:hypothetical protein
MNDVVNLALDNLFFLCRLSVKDTIVGVALDRMLRAFAVAQWQYSTLQTREMLTNSPLNLKG